MGRGKKPKQSQGAGAEGFIIIIINYIIIIIITKSTRLSSINPLGFISVSLLQRASPISETASTKRRPDRGPGHGVRAGSSSALGVPMTSRNSAFELPCETSSLTRKCTCSCPRAQVGRPLTHTLWHRAGRLSFSSVARQPERSLLTGRPWPEG